LRDRVDEIESGSILLDATFKGEKMRVNYSFRSAEAANAAYEEITDRLGGSDAIINTEARIWGDSNTLSFTEEWELRASAIEICLRHGAIPET